MGKNTKFDESGDSEELQALFDSFAPTASRRRLELVIESPASNGVTGWSGISGGDGAVSDAACPTDAGSWESALASDPVPETPHVETGPGEDRQPGVQVNAFTRLGLIARQTQDALRAAGNVRAGDDAGCAAPGIGESLKHLVQMGEFAATRVRNAVRAGKPIQESIGCQATDLSARWEGLFACRMSVEDFERLALDTRTFLSGLREQSKTADEQLTEAMLAQHAQDMSVLALKRLADAAYRIEDELVRLLVETAPPDRLSSDALDAMNGARLRAGGRLNHEQMEGVLKALGF